MKKSLDSKAAKLSLGTPRKHHSRSASTLQNREACAAYAPTSGDNEASLAGTLQHDAAEKEDLSQLDDLQSRMVQLCIDYKHNLIAEMAKKFGKKPRVEQEQYRAIDDEKLPDGSLGTSAGFSDLAVLSPCLTEAEIVDYKFGKWPVAEASANRQGQTYALGLKKKYPTLKKIRVTFLLPYQDVIDSHEFTEPDFADLYRDIKTIVARTFEKNPEEKPSSGVCIFCANIGKCKAVAAMAIKIGRKYAPAKIPDDLSPENIHSADQAGQGMLLAGIMETWAKGFRAETTNKAIEDEDFMPEGYSLVQTSKRKVVDVELLTKVAVDGKWLTKKEIDALKDIPLGAVEKAVKAKAPRGEKEAAAEKFGEEAAAAGAVEMGNPFSYLKLDKTSGEED